MHTNICSPILIVGRLRLTQTQPVPIGEGSHWAHQGAWMSVHVCAPACMCMCVRVVPFVLVWAVLYTFFVFLPLILDKEIKSRDFSIIKSSIPCWCTDWAVGETDVLSLRLVLFPCVFNYEWMLSLLLTFLISSLFSFKIITFLITTKQ